MIFVPMIAEHAMQFGEMEPIHGPWRITPEIAVEIEAIGATTGIDRGEVLAIAGVLPRWQGVGLAWAWLGRSWRRQARAITEQCARGLADTSLHRVEMGVAVDYERGHRWARRLGFTLETPVARGWGPDKADYALYVRLQ